MRKRKKLTDGVLSQMLELISIGVPVSRVCVRFGVSPSALYQLAKSDDGLNERLERAKMKPPTSIH